MNAGRCAQELAPKLLYLASGVVITLYSQWVAARGAVDARTHLLAWTKYAFVFLSSLLLDARRGAEAVRLPPRGRLLLALSGILDVSSYAFSCLGFARCGTLISITVGAACSQASNAALSVLVMKRQLPPGRKAALAVVALGTGMRSLDYLRAEGGAALAGEWTPEVAAGAACIAASSFGYSVLGVLYEGILAVSPQLSHFQYQRSTAYIGLVAATAYQLAYTVPHWETHVAGQLEASGTSGWQLAAMLVCFGGLFNCNAYFQALLFKQEDGALGVSVATAMRGAAVSFLSGLLFCSPAAPWQCLTFWRGASALVVSAGGLLWTLHSPALRRPRDAAASKRD
mmetsp:Transcript_27265/g.68656  ORF Transcript_27265/g.68656 Transcript_27265/m.68656 type:complete len:342 (+) Transcript_27265:24-1049(+)|eukprot:jgi/Tetstr1/465319/TSEL_010014.t1